MREKVAWIISLVFGPPVTTPLLLFLALFKEKLPLELFIINLLLIVLVDIIFPSVVFVLSLKEKWISDWEVTRLKERFHFFILLVFLGFMGASFFYFLGSYLLFNLHLILVTSFFLATIISFFWKISIHMLVDATLISLLANLFPALHFLYFFLPLIAWSRYVRHKHTPGQLLAGFLLAQGVVWGGFKVLGYL